MGDGEAVPAQLDGDLAAVGVELEAKEAGGLGGDLGALEALAGEGAQGAGGLRRLLPQGGAA